MKQNDELEKKNHELNYEVLQKEYQEKILLGRNP